MIYEQLLAAWQQQHPGPVDGDAFNAWTLTLPGGQGGDWSQITSTTVPQTPIAVGNPTVPSGTDTPQGGLDLGALTTAGTAPAIQVPAITTPAVAPTGAQGYSQNQVGGQTGGYTSIGGSTSQQSGTQETDTTQAQSGSQVNTGTQQSTGVQSGSGSSTSTTGVNAPFDIGALVNGQLGSAEAADTQRNAFLNDVMATGGQQFGSQVDQAVRNSLSGPQMTGAGDSARARAAGYAGAEVARNNLDQRIGAAGQLANANANTNSTLAATTPLMGQTTSGSNTNSSATSNLLDSANTALTNSNSTGSSSQMNLQDLVSNEGQAGTATGASMQQGFGVTPQGQTQSSGGCVVCTAYVARREMKPGAVRRACAFKKANWERYGTSLSGYLLVGPLLARTVLSSNLFARLFRPFARAVLYQEVRLSAPTRLKFRWSAYAAHAIFDMAFWPIGVLRVMLSVEHGVIDRKIVALLKAQNLHFSI